MRSQLFGARGNHAAQTMNKCYLSVKHPVACSGAGEERDPHLLAQDLCTENMKTGPKIKSRHRLDFQKNDLQKVRFLTHLNGVI
jgi:hypothetical protein